MKRYAQRASNDPDIAMIDYISVKYTILIETLVLASIYAYFSHAKQKI
jgi:hypothetical protein